MPWIHVTAPPTVASGPSAEGQLQAWVADCAAQVASLLRLQPDDVVVIVTYASGVSAPGALVTVAGRDRGAEVEKALGHLLRSLLHTLTGVAEERIAVLRR